MRYSDVRMTLQFCYSGVKVVLQWWYTAFTMLLQHSCKANIFMCFVFYKVRDNAWHGITHTVTQVRVPLNSLSVGLEDLLSQNGITMVRNCCHIVVTMCLHCCHKREFTHVLLHDCCCQESVIKDLSPAVKYLDPHNSTQERVELMEQLQGCVESMSETLNSTLTMQKVDTTINLMRETSILTHQHIQAHTKTRSPAQILSVIRNRSLIIWNSSLTFRLH
jgi:hypothetical protein